MQALRQRYAEQDLIGIIVRHRVGGDLLRPSACAIYSQYGCDMATLQPGGKVTPDSANSGPGFWC